MATPRQVKYQESLQRLENLSKRYAEVEGARYKAQLTEQRMAQQKMEDEMRRAKARARKHQVRRNWWQGVGATVGLGAGIAGTVATNDPKLIATGLQGGLALGNIGADLHNGEGINPNNVLTLGSAATGFGGSIKDEMDRQEAAKATNAAYGTAPGGGQMQPYGSKGTRGYGPVNNMSNYGSIYSPQVAGAPYVSEPTGPDERAQEGTWNSTYRLPPAR
jgi:surface antigen